MNSNQKWILKEETSIFGIHNILLANFEYEKVNKIPQKMDSACSKISILAHKMGQSITMCTNIALTPGNWKREKVTKFGSTFTKLLQNHGIFSANLEPTFF
jgi:hypothetical protein